MSPLSEPSWAPHLCGAQLALPRTQAVLKRLLERRERHALRHHDLVVEQLRHVLRHLQDERARLLVGEDLKVNVAPLALHLVERLRNEEERSTVPPARPSGHGLGCSVTVACLNHGQLHYGSPTSDAGIVFSSARTLHSRMYGIYLEYRSHREAVNHRSFALPSLKE